MRRTINIAVVALCLSTVFLFVCQRFASAQTTIFADDFSGAGGALDGALEDEQGAAWIANSAFLDNGTLVAADAGSAVLDFNPQLGATYTLSMDVTINSESNQWIALGFSPVAPTAPATSNGNDRFSNITNPGAGPWMLFRDSLPANGVPGDLSMFSDRTGGGLVSVADLDTDFGFPGEYGSTFNLEIIVDTTGDGSSYTADYRINGASQQTGGSPVTINRAVSDLSFAGLSYAGGSPPVAPTFDNFSLTELITTVINEWNVDGGGDFSTAGNWTQGTPTPGSTVRFGGILTAPNSPAAINMDVAASLDTVILDNGAAEYNITGSNTLTLVGSGSVTVVAGAHEISAPIAGSNLNKGGAGTLLLTGANTFSGSTNVTAGALRVNAPGSIPGNVDISDGATFGFIGDELGGGFDGTFSNAISGAGGVFVSGTLTTETVTLSGTNSYTGVTNVNGGTLRVASDSALGAGTNVPDDGTILPGDLEDSTLSLSSANVASEHLTLGARQPENSTPHVTSSGTSAWGGDIVGTTGGNQYNIRSDSGTLTLSGNISGPDNTDRNFVFDGAGNGRITGSIVDRTDAIADGAENANINVIKRGSGTWTIATGTGVRDDYHQGRTVIEEGTLAVEEGAPGVGELRSRTIEVRENTTFDVSDYTGSYALQLVDDPDTIPSSGDEAGQTLTGAGTVFIGAGKRISAFDDSTIAPGDSVGTLSITGDFRYSTFGDNVTGGWNYELGDTTAAGDSDRLDVSGTATINAGASTNQINVNVQPVEGTLATGSYALVQAASATGTANIGNYNIAVRDAQGNDITADVRQSFTITNSATAVNLNVTGASANLNWAGTSGSNWDVGTTNNWTGGSTQFQQLDNVTFGNVSNKSVTVLGNVAPGSVTFNGGGGSTYTVTGSGGMTGYGPVNVNTGTVQLNNTGNDYAGTTTVAAGARLEMNTASTGDVVVNGTLSVGGAGVAAGGFQTFFSDDFSGAGGALNGATPDTTTGGANWVAAPTFEDDGDSVIGTAGGSATLAFTPIDGSTYTLETSIQNVSGDNDWFALGFANGQSAANSGNARFINIVEGLAWSLYRGDASVTPNTAFRGDEAAVNGGVADGADWLVDASTSGGDVVLRITLDTTGGAGNWTATWEADTGSGFQTVRNAETLLSEAINSVGVAVSNTADITGTLDSFTLTGTEPAGARLDGQTLTIDGDLVMGASSILELDFAAFGQDFVDVTGMATLDGTISVTQLGSFTPVGGTEYTLLSAAEGINDLGVTFDLPSNFNASIIGGTDLVLSFGLPGDADGDGDVDGADFLLLQRTNPAGIPDWQANYPGPGPLSASTDTVPEPSTAVLAVCGLMILFRSNHRCR